MGPLPHVGARAALESTRVQERTARGTDDEAPA